MWLLSYICDELADYPQVGSVFGPGGAIDTMDAFGQAPPLAAIKSGESNRRRISGRSRRYLAEPMMILRNFGRFVFCTVSSPDDSLIAVD
jgi:hypothetical protein